MTTSTTSQLERRWGDALRARLPGGVSDFVMFVVKQGWACLFGALMLLGLIVTRAVWQQEWGLTRYDALLLYAIALQAGFLILKLETWAEARVIVLFHITGTVMEICKVDQGSWSYPDNGIMKLWGVPLFSGFMYASVGSYIARVIRIFDMRFAPFPPLWSNWALATAIYLNFFTHHILPDLRSGLILCTIALFWRTKIWFRVRRFYWMPLPVAALLTAFFLWIAENIGTSTGTWLYAGQTVFDHVSLAKLGSWYMLLYVSFATVTLVQRDTLLRTAWQPSSTGNTTTDTQPKPTK